MQPTKHIQKGPHRNRKPNSDDKTEKKIRAKLRVRVPIAIPKGRKTSFLTIARFSKEEQRKQSNPAQHRFNRANINANVENLNQCEWEEVSDAAISGELRSRPGIDYVREGIARRKWDLIVAEDSSRIFRNLLFCLELVSAAVDQKIRVICINDDVDTAEPGWKERLQEAQKHHCQDNKYTRNRLERTIEDLWEDGAAVGHLRSGYDRIPSVPATAREPAEGPFFDKISKKWKPVIKQAFERVAADECRWTILDWLTEKGLPKTNGKIGPWSMREFTSMIQCTLYKGVEQRGKTKTTQACLTGESKQERNPCDQIKERKMPHLRIVTDPLWLRANNVIKEDNTRANYPLGEANPLFGIPRKSRQPLSEIFFCGICHYKMYADGRNEGGYRCSRCMSKRGGLRIADVCWNKATAVRDLVHSRISTAVYEQIIASEGIAGALVAFVGEQLVADDHWDAEDKRLVGEVRRLDTICQRLVASIESRPEPSQRILDQLAAREDDLMLRKEELDLLRADRQAPRKLPTSDEIRASLRRSASEILSMDTAAGSMLKKLVGDRIEAVPYQQFGSNKVVLRAEFTLHLVQVLPYELRQWLLNKSKWNPNEWLPPVNKFVDLFPVSTIPANAVRAAELKKTNRTREVQAILGLPKCQVARAIRMGQAMEAAEITDPYIRLTQSPETVSRWRTVGRRKKPQKKAG